MLVANGTGNATGGGNDTGILSGGVGGVRASQNDSTTTAVNYTIMADGGLAHIDVIKHSSDYERRILPLQWAIDSVSGGGSSQEGIWCYINYFLLSPLPLPLFFCV